ncbi:dienelactone hydrolase family protein [Demequina muriae]|uniref:Dienelactone hydrolase family protein n=1 Tax=Demequina muriae TaxID=3051664 RepID=A0ABT8GE13_9MICO|nr:dienelactone hydrolase family protein [Demequina sp. EGI L300058]MDN4479668.1 dienelactone hydrolase family protein [Demequina sp. EGI L300058]
MAEILMLHHVHGLTEGLCSLADRLRASGHTVHTPDVFGGRTFASIDDGIAYADRIGHDALLEAAQREARHHPHADVVMGFSMGAGPAQHLAQVRRRMRGCVLVGGASSAEMHGSTWRPRVALQIHVADPDDWCTADEVGALEREVPTAEVYRYPHQRHMFVDPSTRDYDADAADTFEERLNEWLLRLDA